MTDSEWIEWHKDHMVPIYTNRMKKMDIASHDFMGKKIISFATFESLCNEAEQEEQSSIFAALLELSPDDQIQYTILTNDRTLVPYMDETHRCILELLS